ncbi:protein phosphatase 1H-like, partial [Tropilaelaps mercedesae]
MVLSVFGGVDVVDSQTSVVWEGLPMHSPTKWLNGCCCLQHLLIWLDMSTIRRCSTSRPSAITPASGAAEVSCGDQLRVLSSATVWGVVEMLSRVRNAFYNVVQNLDAFPVDDDQLEVGTGNGTGPNNDSRKLKFNYSRPEFLQLGSSEEIQASADHTLRPILVPRNISLLPWTAGYAETVNAGKSIRNEDQATCQAGAISPDPGCAQILEHATPNELEHHLNHCRDCIPYRYFALFDGHAGAAVAVAASRTLHRVIHLRLQQISSLLRNREKDGRIPLGPQYGAYSSAIFNNCDSK